MELVPSTADALARLERLGATEVHAGLESIARLPELIAPQCVGLGMGLVEDGLTFTLAASDLQTVGLDAIQYLDRGPCVDAVHGVQSSLSMPLVDGDRVVGGVNLSFSSRLYAAEAPKILAKQADVDLATGHLAASQGIDTQTAERRLREAAERAGTSPVDVARTVIRMHITGSESRRPPHPRGPQRLCAPSPSRRSRELSRSALDRRDPTDAGSGGRREQPEPQLLPVVGR